jgi:ubiquinone/menaquinone biosynthesis C-methylase UbiE
MTVDNPKIHWDEETSNRYIDYGRFFVPQREHQMRIMVDLRKGLPSPCLVLELCCGEGLLAELLSDELPGSSYWGLDGSHLMLEQTGLRFSRFGGRVKLNSFALAGSRIGDNFHLHHHRKKRTMMVSRRYRKEA